MYMKIQKAHPSSTNVYVRVHDSQQVLYLYMLSYLKLLAQTVNV